MKRYRVIGFFQQYSNAGASFGEYESRRFAEQAAVNLTARPDIKGVEIVPMDGDDEEED